MKVTLIMVTTLDGIAARNDHDHTFTWNSKEDQVQFREISKKIGAVLTGSKTFESVGRKSLLGRKTFVLTRSPEKYNDVQDATIVTGSAKEVYNLIKAHGVEHLALIGGPTINYLFLKANLVDEILVTIEPRMFGEGFLISSGGGLDLKLKLTELTKLNEQGTLLLNYQVLK